VIIGKATVRSSFQTYFNEHDHQGVNRLLRLDRRFASQPPR